MSILRQSLLLACALTIGTTLFAQTYSDREESFALTQSGGHYMFTAQINGQVQATIMLESGIPALLVDSAFAFSSGCLRDLNLEPSESRINMGGNLFNITHKAQGTVMIGRNTSYRGKIWILAGYDDGSREISIPLQYVHNEADKGSSIVYVDLAAGRMEMYCRQHMGSQEIKACSTFRINTRTYMHMPAVKTTMTLLEGGRERKLKGNYMVDFGNAELMFLIAQSKKVQKFLDANPDIELQDARTPSGQVIAQMILSDECTLLGKTYADAVVPITRNLPNFTTECGLLGLKFFAKAPAILDFDRGRMYVK